MPSEPDTTGTTPLSIWTGGHTRDLARALTATASDEEVELIVGKALRRAYAAGFRRGVEAAAGVCETAQWSRECPCYDHECHDWDAKAIRALTPDTHEPENGG